MSIGAYQSFWLENGSHRLYAAFHSTAGDDTGNEGLELAPAVLLVPPLLHQYHRSVRFLCELASMFADAGLPCMRYCNFGSGDSEGEGWQASAATIAEDLQRAADWLKVASGRREIVVVAFRSASLSVQAWLDVGGSADGMVLWDPLLDGNRWLQSLRQLDAEKRATITAEPGAEGEDGELMGCAVAPEFLRQLEGLQWKSSRHIDSRSCFAVIRDSASMPAGISGRIGLPDTVPEFGDSVLMDATLFFSMPMQRVVRSVAAALTMAPA